MEDSSINHSSMEKAFSASPAEESGWTSYFEDFSDHNEEDHSLCCGTFDSSSMVSDAASFPPWKSSNVVAGSSINGGLPRKLTFKKTRAKEISLDDSLEDTASSPVNSPKVSDMIRPTDNHRKTNDQYFSSSLGNKEGSGLEQYAEGLETSERCDIIFGGGKNDCVDLKKRGLCLVPLSMLVNYLG